MNRAAALVLLWLLVAVAPLPAFAQVVVVGGYDVVKVAGETIGALAGKGVLSDDEAKAFRGAVAAIPAGDPLLAAGPLVDLYEQLFDRLIAQSLLTAGDVVLAKRAAAQSGGVKAAGLNPLILAASCLDLLAQKGLIALPQAQRILDTAKV